VGGTDPQPYDRSTISLLFEPTAACGECEASVAATSRSGWVVALLVFLGVRLHQG
jgi:hypothetical protein